VASMAEPSRRAPRPYVIYALCVAATGFAALAISWAVRPPTYTPVLAVLLLATLIAESLALELPSGAIYSLSYPLTMAVVVMFGPAAAGLAAVLSSFNTSDLRRRKSPFVYAFNAGQLAVSASVAAWVYLLLGGTLLVQRTAGGFRYVAFSEASSILVALLSSALVSVLLNDVLVSFGVHLFYRVPWTRVTSAEVAWMAPSQLVLAAVGFSMAQVLSISRPALLLFVVPLFVARQVFQRYARLRDAYLDTVRSLVAAVEAKDPYTRGHSERVTEYAGRLGAALGMSQSELERLEYAALLHDVGTIGVPARVLTKAGRLTQDEYARVKEHPMVGAQIVSRVPYLADIVDSVLHHHEHFDGSGYGLGASGSAIPLMARILAVVDAYDAMTSERPYRRALSVAEAVEELNRCAGTQFDPEIVVQFVELVPNEDVQSGTRRDCPERSADG
jgi:HD-GYP domain-containing protein (c-di-GMP phosphodiesterase class II)